MDALKLPIMNKYATPSHAGIMRVMARICVYEICNGNVSVNSHMMPCDMMPCDMMQCDMMQCDMMPCDMMQCQCIS